MQYGTNIEAEVVSARTRCRTPQNRPLKRITVLYLLTLSSVAVFMVFSAFRDAGSSDAPGSTVSEEAFAADAASTRYNLKFPQEIRPPALKVAYDFAGERVPIEDTDVRERLERELVTNTFYHTSTTFNIKSATRHFPLIESILREEGVPEDLKYIVVAESGFRNVTSPAGAKGFWQFMKGTGQQYGLEIDGEVDERYHLEKSTRAAAHFLRDLHDKVGSWTLAAAAYNRGGSGIASQVLRQRAEDYYDLNLNEETSRYVFRIVAMKDILEDPTHYGYFIDADQLYTPIEHTKDVEVSESIANLGDWAKQYDASYRELKVLNPWLIESKLTVSAGNTYTLRVPRR